MTRGKNKKDKGRGSKGDIGGKTTLKRKEKVRGGGGGKKQGRNRKDRGREGNQNLESKKEE